MKEKTSKMMHLKRALLVMLLSAFSVFTYAQNKTISGTVKDDKGEPAIGATVKVKGTGIGTMTDFDGNYTLEVPSDAKTLEVSYVGMETKEVAISGPRADVVLGESSQALEEVVVTGYGTTKKRDVVTSVASVGAEQLKNIPVTSAAEALQGKLTGVSVTTTEGSPDADVKIRVRGGSSLTQSSDPLYIVDGFPVSSISDIAPSDIQSMDVLKDAAATAIYGAQGANGVIIITTKEVNTDDKGEDCGMKFNVDYTGYMGWKKMSKRFDVLNARDFELMQYEYAYMTKKGVQGDIASNFSKYFDNKFVSNGENKEFMSDIAFLLDTVSGADYTDWQDKTFGRSALTSNHNVSVSGGNKKASFTFSYNRIDDEGIMQESDYTRNNFNLKTKFKPVKGLTIRANTRYTSTDVLGSGANTADDAGSKSESRVENAIAYTPIQLLAKDASSLDDEESYGSMYDPLTTISDNYKYKKDRKWDLNGGLSYTFLKKFTINADLGYRSTSVETDRFYGKTTYYSRDGDGKTGAGGQAGYTSALRTNEVSSRLNQKATFEYKDKYSGGHNFNVLLGEEILINKAETNVNYGYGYVPTFSGKEVFEHLGTYKNSARTQYIDPTDNMLSFFGRANYDYKGRYLITATMRADASTRFSKENQWGFFPAAAAAWRISDEPWMKSAARAAQMSNLKLRFSFGVAGNNNVELGYLYPDFVSSTSSNLTKDIHGVSGNYLNVGGSDKIAANPNLKWETTTTRNLGLDYGFFNDRLSGALDLYWNTTEDLIIKFKTPAYYNYQYRNVAKTKNMGIEFAVKGVILDGGNKDLNYNLTVDANISANKNTVESLGGMSEYYVSTGYLSANHFGNDAEFILREGRSVGEIYGFVSDGIYTTADFDEYDATNFQWKKDGKTIASPIAANSYAYPGLLKLKDLNGDGNITADDRTVIGCTMPKFNGGFAITASVGGQAWGSVDFNANFTYSYGNDVLNLTGMRMSSVHDKTKLRNTLASTAYGSRYSLFTSNGGYIPSQFATSGSVTGEDYVALAKAVTDANAGYSTYSPVVSNTVITKECVEDGSFLRLASLTVGYSLPNKWISKAHISKARIFFTASNLFCITNYSGSDPEVDTGSKRNPLAIGVDFSAYPKSRAFNFGLNLSF